MLCRNSIEDDEGAGKAPMSRPNSKPQESTPDEAHLALPQLPKIVVNLGAASPQHAVTYSPRSSQVQLTSAHDATGIAQDQ